LVSIVSERAASDHDFARCSRSTAPPQLATQLITGIFRTDCMISAAAQHLRHLPGSTTSERKEVSKQIRHSEFRGNACTEMRLHEDEMRKNCCSATTSVRAGIASSKGRDRASALHVELRREPMDISLLRCTHNRKLLEMKGQPRERHCFGNRSNRPSFIKIQQSFVILNNAF
jgi:hypothetical protein